MEMTHQGLWIPLITPFRDGELDEASLQRLTAHCRWSRSATASQRRSTSISSAPNYATQLNLQQQAASPPAAGSLLQQGQVGDRLFLAQSGARRVTGDGSECDNHHGRMECLKPT